MVDLELVAETSAKFGAIPMLSVEAISTSRESTTVKLPVVAVDDIVPNGLGGYRWSSVFMPANLPTSPPRSRDDEEVAPFRVLGIGSDFGGPILPWLPPLSSLNT